jgi:hypothetical protein
MFLLGTIWTEIIEITETWEKFSTSPLGYKSEEKMADFQTNIIF